MRKKSIEVFVVLSVHSNITIIDDIICKIALLKKIKNKKAPSMEKKDRYLGPCLWSKLTDNQRDSRSLSVFVNKIRKLNLADILYFVVNRIILVFKIFNFTL